MSTINISTTSIPKFVFDSKVYGAQIIDRISEKFYSSPIDDDKFDSTPESRYSYVEIANMKLWKSFSIDKFIIIAKDYGYADPCILVTKNKNDIVTNFGHANGVIADLHEEYHYSEDDTCGEQNTLQIFNTDDHKNCCIKWTLLVMNLFEYCNDFFDKKEVMLGKKNKKKKSLVSYTFNIKKFGSEFIGVNSYDSITIKNGYKMFDPYGKIRNVFPFDKVIARIPLDDYIESIVFLDKINSHKIALKVYENYKINFYNKKCSHDSWGIGRLCEVEYDTVKSIFSDCIFSAYYTGETEEDEKIDTDQALDSICILFDTLKYMVFNTKKVENNKIYFNSQIKINKKGCKDKYRNNVEMCSTVYEIDGQTIKQVDDTVISETHRQVKPCEYSFTVRGHYRHLKDGRMIWVNSYIKNKDKEFKSKNYIDKK